MQAALFAFQNPLSGGALLADEVGLGETIEAGLVISQKWAEYKRRILIITPANLRKQWVQELSEKFFLPVQIIETASYNAARKRGITQPFVIDQIMICSYQFAARKAEELGKIGWDLVVMDEAHRLRNVYKTSNVTGNLLKKALRDRPKLLLTATPLQNSLLELYGLVSLLAEQGEAEGQDKAGGTEGTPRPEAVAPVFRTLEGQRIAAATVQAVRDLSRELARVPNAEALLTPEAQQTLVERVQARLTPIQPSLLDAKAASTQTTDTPTAPDLSDVVRQATEVLVRGTISIPRIMVVPEGEVKTLFAPFTLDLSGVNYRASDTTLVAYNLRDNSQERLGGEWEGGIRERRIEDLVVRAIMRNAEVSYADNADTLYTLADQVVAHFKARGDDDRAIEAILLTYEAPLSSLIFKQMREHQKTPPMTYVYEVRQGLTELRPGTLTAGRGGVITNTHQVPPSGTHIRTYLYTGFRRSLYPQIKFDSIPELRLAQVLEREAEKWFRPMAGQFQIHYHYQESWHPYQPDFVAETQNELLLIEVKARNELSDSVVQEKVRVAQQWCAEASRHAARTGGKPWRYHLVPDDVIQSNSTLDSLMKVVLA